MISKYTLLRYFITMLMVAGAAGSAYASPSPPKCGTAMTFDFDPGTEVEAGTTVTLTEEITVTTPNTDGKCAQAEGSLVDEGNALLQAITLGADGPAKVCADLGKKYCTAGLSTSTLCTVNTDCDSSAGPGDGVCTAVTTTSLVHENPTDGNLTTSVDTTSLGGQTLGYSAQYEGGGNYEKADTICTDLTVNEVEPCTGATISIDRADGPGAPAPGGPYNWSFRVTVHACEDLTGVTAQGGTNGWAQLANNRTLSALHPSDGTTVEIRKANKKADVIYWTIGDMTAGQTETLVVDLTGSIPPKTPDCQVRYLSGPWSALFSTNGGVNFDKTDYTGRVSVQVDSNGNPDDCGP